MMELMARQKGRGVMDIDTILKQAAVRPWPETMETFDGTRVGATARTWQERLASNELMLLAVNSYEPMREALRACVEVLQTVSVGACDIAHHAKPDQHKLGVDCPVEARIRAALAQAQKVMKP